MYARLLLPILSICLVLVRSGSSEFLHSISTPEAGNVEVSAEHGADLVNFTVTFELVKTPLWLAVGLSTQSRMIDTLVMFIKYDNGVVDLFNGYNREYATPVRENSTLDLVTELRINDKVALIFQRQVAFVSTVNPAVSNDLRNCYRIAIASGSLVNQVTLPHSQIPQFTQNCLIIAPEKAVTVVSVPYYVNMSIDSQFTSDLLDPNSVNYFRLRFRIEKFITDALNADSLVVENFQLLSLSPGSVVSISGIRLPSPGLEQQIRESLVKGSTDFLPVIKERIFVSSSLDDSSTTSSAATTTIINSTTSSTTKMAPISNSTASFANSTAAYSTNTTMVNTTMATNTTMVNTTMVTNTTVETKATNSTANVTIQIDYFAAEFKVDMIFTEELKNSSSPDYLSFVSQLDSYIKSGFLSNNQIDALKSWKVENLRQGSIMALTSLGIAGLPEGDKIEIVKKNLESGDKNILPVQSIDIRNFDTTTQTSSSNSAKSTSKNKDDNDDDSSSVSAVAIVVPIICVVFLIIVIIIAICIFRRRRRARNSYILQTSEQNRAFDANSRTSEIPRNPPRFSSEDDLSRHTMTNLSSRFKSANDDSPPNINSLGKKDKRDSGPPSYSMTDKSSDHFKEIPLGNDQDDKIEMDEINVNKKDNAVLNYDTSDIDDTRPNLGSIIKKSNNPLFQMDE